MNDNKKHTQPREETPSITAPFARRSTASEVVQSAVDAECKHPRTPYLRKDEPMQPYGLD